MSSVLRSGRLAAPRRDVVDFISSVQDDQRIARSTVFVNQAHVIALTKAQAIDRGAARKILRALHELEKKKIVGQDVEDVHVLIEEHVTKRTGNEVGGQLHLGKSRNDQVATAIRMTLRDNLITLSDQLISFELALLKLARKHTSTVFPGYTHLQPAQPLSFAHYLVANGDAIVRDIQRILGTFARVNLSPMGAGAIAGTSFNLDRLLVAKLLGFDGLVEVSLDAVGSRDFALEALSVYSLAALDIARIAEDLIFYSSGDVGLIVLPDEFTSTSSIMPQKKNPDPLELIRARCAQVMGNFNTAALTMHALPSGYNLDYQEITPLIWKSHDTLSSCLKILVALIPRIRVDRSIAKRDLMQFTTATEIANVLVRERKMPFRKAHHMAGVAVRLALDKGMPIKQLRVEDWRRIVGRNIDDRTLKSIFKALDVRSHLDAYRTIGSPNPKEMKRIIGHRMQHCQSLMRENKRIVAGTNRVTRDLHSTSEKI